MLLRLEPEIERERLDGGVREIRVLKYDGLKRRVKGEGKAQRVVDIIVSFSFAGRLVSADSVGDSSIWRSTGIRARLRQWRAVQGVNHTS